MPNHWPPVGALPPHPGHRFDSGGTSRSAVRSGDRRAAGRRRLPRPTNLRPRHIASARPVQARRSRPASCTFDPHAPSCSWSPRPPTQLEFSWSVHCFNPAHSERGGATGEATVANGHWVKRIRADWIKHPAYCSGSVEGARAAARCSCACSPTSRGPLPSLFGAARSPAPKVIERPAGALGRRGLLNSGGVGHLALKGRFLGVGGTHPAQVPGLGRRVGRCRLGRGWPGTRDQARRARRVVLLAGGEGPAGPAGSRRRRVGESSPQKIDLNRWQPL